MDIFKPKDRQRYIEYTLNRYYKNDHKKKFDSVLYELKNIQEPVQLDLRYNDNNCINITVLILHIFILIYNF